MGVSNIFSIRFFVFTCSVVLCSACNANVGTESKELLDHVSKKALKATASYGERIEHCDKLVESNDVPQFSKEKLTSLNATREDVITAVAFLKFNNYFACERNARMELAFHLGTMESLKRELEVSSSSVEELQSVVSYPSSKELELEIKYLKLSQPQRDYFESIVGRSPFDLMKVLEENNLMRE